MFRLASKRDVDSVAWRTSNAEIELEGHYHRLQRLENAINAIGGLRAELDGIKLREKRQQETIADLRIGLSADNEKLEMGLVAVSDKATAVRKKQREIIIEVKALRAELTTVHYKQVDLHVALDTFASISLELGKVSREHRQLIVADVAILTAKFDALLAYLGLEAAQTPVQETAWELRDCTKD